MKRLDHFTHTDLDGVGCAVLSTLTMITNNTELFIHYVNYEEVNEAVMECLEQNQSDFILITDISVNAEVAEALDAWSVDHALMLVDHHPNLPEALLSKKWARVDASGNHCGTSLLYSIILADVGGIDNQCLDSFVDAVRQYDLWQFDKTTRNLPRDLNMLRYMMSENGFIQLMKTLIGNYPHSTMFFPYTVRDILDAKYNEEERYCRDKALAAVEVIYNGHKGRAIHADSYISQVGHAILEMYNDAEFAAIVKLPSVSLRSRDNGIDVGLEIAKHFGGGGHPHAAGFTLKHIPESMLTSIFEE